MLLTKSSHFTQICFIFTFHFAFLCPSLSRIWNPITIEQSSRQGKITSHFTLRTLSSQNKPSAYLRNGQEQNAHQKNKTQNVNKQISALRIIEEQRSARRQSESVFVYDPQMVERETYEHLQTKCLRQSNEKKSTNIETLSIIGTFQLMGGSQRTFSTQRSFDGVVIFWCRQEKSHQKCIDSSNDEFY